MSRLFRPRFYKIHLKPLKNIKDMAKIEREAQYEWAVKRVEALLPLVGEDAPEDDPARIELELLSKLVSEYSEAHFAIG